MTNVDESDAEAAWRRADRRVSIGLGILGACIDQQWYNNSGRWLCFFLFLLRIFNFFCTLRCQWDVVKSLKRKKTKLRVSGQFRLQKKERKERLSSRAGSRPQLHAW
jgi:hypothetical protein